MKVQLGQPCQVAFVCAAPVMKVLSYAEKNKGNNVKIKEKEVSKGKFLFSFALMIDVKHAAVAIAYLVFICWWFIG